MRERTRTGLVVVYCIVIGVVIGALMEHFHPWLEVFLGVSESFVFGIGLAVVEGPTLIAAIILSRKVTRAWVRSALQATGPFLGFSAYLIAWGVLLLHPITSLPLIGNHFISRYPAGATHRFT